jgi:hypothetical protein
MKADTNRIKCKFSNKTHISPRGKDSKRIQQRSRYQSKHQDQNTQYRLSITKIEEAHAATRDTEQK